LRTLSPNWESPRQWIPNSYWSSPVSMSTHRHRYYSTSPLQWYFCWSVLDSWWRISPFPIWRILSFRCCCPPHRSMKIHKRDPIHHCHLIRISVLMWLFRVLYPSPFPFRFIPNSSPSFIEIVNRIVNIIYRECRSF
jgi:hypothetical protein